MSTTNLPARHIFSERLKSLRLSRAITSGKMADLLGFSQPVYSRYENGRVPDTNTVAVIADKCGVTVDWLLGRELHNVNPKGHCGALLGADCEKGLPQAGYSVDLPGAGMAERFMESSAEMNRRIDELNARIARLEMLRDPEVQKAINAYVKDALKDYFEEERRKLGKSETG